MADNFYDDENQEQTPINDVVENQIGFEDLLNNSSNNNLNELAEGIAKNEVVNNENLNATPIEDVIEQHNNNEEITEQQSNIEEVIEQHNNNSEIKNLHNESENSAKHDITKTAELVKNLQNTIRKTNVKVNNETTEDLLEEMGEENEIQTNNNVEEVFENENSNEVIGESDNRIYTSSILSGIDLDKAKRKRNVKLGNAGDGDDGSVDGVVTKSVEQVIHESMMPYSEFVILDRALPRVEDGLKPVQRRVLYSMLEVGVTPDKPYRKSARIVGDCMGKYHPHGDRSIYDTMVRMAQNFNMGEVLVDGHGNYGSVDGDGAAAMRYTEARLSPISLELLRDIEKDTVSWSFNFDDTRKEPDMLPGRFPNLLVNGSQGIAVGLATNIPTHNLNETINAVTAYINNPNITLDEIMKFLPAPDFSTGGYILSSSELKQVYETGKGKITMRAKLHIENVDESGKKNIVITEIPYQVNKAVMLQKIAKLKENDTTGVFNNIYDIVDESDRQGTRAVIKLKKDTNVKRILKALYKSSDLQINFNANMVAIADGKPKQLALLEIISYYVNYQQKVVFNRTKYDLEVSEKRAHILEGLIVAIKNIDKVIKIIKASKSTNEAKKTLMEVFILTDVQAQAILDMRLAKLTNLEVNKIVEELKGLNKLIAEYKEILKSPTLQMNIVKRELQEIKDKYGSPRKTEIINEEEDIAADDEEQTVNGTNDYVNIIISAEGTIKNVPIKSYNLANKEFGENSKLSEIPVISLQVLQNKNIYLFTNLGNCHKVAVKNVPISKFKDKGTNINSLVKNYADNEKVVAMFDFDENNKEDDLVFVTKQGMIKLTKLSEYFGVKQSIAAIKLRENDELIFVNVNNKNKNLFLFTHDGMSVNVGKDDITLCARVSMGVKGIALSDKDFVVSAIEEGQADAFVVFTSNGFGKVMKKSEIPPMARNRKGIKIIDTKKPCSLLNVFKLSKNDNYVAQTEKEELIYVVNKKIVLDNKIGTGRSVLGNRVGGKTKCYYKYHVIQ